MKNFVKIVVLTFLVQLLGSQTLGMPVFFEVAQAATGAVNHFEIGDLPASIQPNKNISFKVTAQDDKNQTVQNYTGKIHFSAEGNNSINVKLPEDYTFKAEDLGIHQFSLGLSFPANGTYKMVVADLSNVLIKGEKAVTVGAANGNDGSKDNNSLKPTIDTPTAGTSSQKAQTVSGAAPAGYTVKIYDNEKELGAVQVPTNGKYTYQTSPLSDDVHKIYVVALDATQTVKGTSDTVQVTIDTTPPTLDKVDLNPSTGLKPGDVVNVDVTSEENLSQAAMVFHSDITPLNASPDKPGHYVASVQAPKTAGVYPIDFVLVDQLGNEGSYKAKAQVTVAAGDAASTPDANHPAANDQSTPATPPDTVVTPPPTDMTGTPSKVTGIISYGGDKRVTLVWDAATDAGTIQHYRIYYGLDAADLKTFADTKDAATTWYIPNLENGKQYSFAITAFNTDGKESAARSEIVTGIPYKSEVSSLPKVDTNTFYGNGSSDAVNGFDQLHPAAFDAGVGSQVSQTGPEMIWFFSGSGLASLFWQKNRRRKNMGVSK